MSAVLSPEPTRLPPALPAPYAAPPADEALSPHPATVSLVRAVVRDLLVESPSFRALGVDDRRALAKNLVHVGSYLAECVRDDWYQSGRIGQRPLVRVRPPLAVAEATAGQDFASGAANQVGRVTTETLRAVAFPVFVADLIKGTFNAITEASTHQMDSYMKLLDDVGKTAPDVARDNVSDKQARAWLAGKYPDHIEVKNDRAVPKAGADDREPPNFRVDLNLSEDATLDESSIEETLVPAARRKLAQSQLTLMSTLVLMGINRIVVTGGKIRATMGFHINTRDQSHREDASQFDTRLSASGSYGVGIWSVSASASVAYVSSTKADSNAELNTQTDLTGEVEIHFQSDYFPIERFATSEGIDKIRANTPVPATNVPTTPIPWGDTSTPRPVESMGAARQPSTTPFADISRAPGAPTAPTAPTPPAAAPAKDGTSAKGAAAAPAAKPAAAAAPAAKPAPAAAPAAKPAAQPATDPAAQPAPAAQGAQPAAPQQPSPDPSIPVGATS
jgi:hypothetical protein